MQSIVGRYLDYLRAGRNASPHTIRTYQMALLGNKTAGKEKGFFQYLLMRKIPTLEAVNKQVLRDYMYWLREKGIARSSVANKLSAIRSFYRYLVREEIIRENPLEQITSPKLDKHLPDFLSAEEIERLLTAPDISTPQGQRDRAILELLYASGLRVSELVRLDTGQINPDTREIRVTGKGHKERIVLMGEPAAGAVTAYLREGRPALLGKKRTTAVFLTRQGERMIERRVQKIIDRHTRAAGIEKKVYPHMLRHTFATHMLDGGADLRVVQELLGHASLSTTQIYTHVSKSQARKVYLAAHPLAKQEAKSDRE